MSAEYQRRREEAEVRHPPPIALLTALSPLSLCTHTHQASWAAWEHQKRSEAAQRKAGIGADAETVRKAERARQSEEVFLAWCEEKDRAARDQRRRDRELRRMMRRKQVAVVEQRKRHALAVRRANYMMQGGGGGTASSGKGTPQAAAGASAGKSSPKQAAAKGSGPESCSPEASAGTATAAASASAGAGTGAGNTNGTGAGATNGNGDGAVAKAGKPGKHKGGKRFYVGMRGRIKPRKLRAMQAKIADNPLRQYVHALHYSTVHRQHTLTPCRAHCTVLCQGLYIMRHHSPTVS